MVLENIQPRGEPVRSCGWGYIADLANYETDSCVWIHATRKKLYSDPGRNRLYVLLINI